MVADEQTQTLPADREGVEHFARFLGFDSRDAFAAVLGSHLRNVQRHYEQLFEAAPAAGAEERGFSFPKDADDAATLDNLSMMVFRNPLQISANVRHWFSNGYRALKSEAARQHLVALLPSLLRHVAKTENPGAVFAAFDHFLIELHAGGRLFSLLRQNPDLLGFIALILGTAPRLADILARYPHVIDPLLEPGFFGSLPDEGKLRAEWDAMGQTTSYEDFLDRIRMFGQEQMFLIGARILRNRFRQASRCGLRQSGRRDDPRTQPRGAGELCRDPWPDPRAANRVAGLGKLGGREMTANSDLDLIMVYDFDADAPQSDGPRPLSGSQYFARLTQRLISALTGRPIMACSIRSTCGCGPPAAPTAGYPVTSFQSYQELDAWTWEHLALTRARIVSASSSEFEQRVADVIRVALSRRRDGPPSRATWSKCAAPLPRERRSRSLGPEVRCRRAGRSRIHRATSAARARRRLSGDLGHLDGARAGQGLAARASADGRGGGAAAGGPALSESDANTAVMPPRRFRSEDRGRGLLRLLVRAGDVPDFVTLDAHVTETEARVRQSFVRILGEAP